jgi:hypothetical protein
MNCATFKHANSAGWNRCRDVDIFRWDVHRWTLQNLCSFLVLRCRTELHIGVVSMRPRDLCVGELQHQRHSLIQGHSDLLHGISLTNGDSLILLGLEVNGDAEWNTNLVGLRIAAADGAR